MHVRCEPGEKAEIVSKLYLSVSHAAAYAYVSYQTAYLKQYYPSEFFAALLTSFLDNTDKVVQYIDECSRMGIHLLPPNINTGSTRFTVNGRDINFSLAAVKNLGRGFIGSVCRERELNGDFSDFYDFCKRMYGRELNRRAVESMIKCGAFDKLGQNRRQLFLSIDAIFDTLDSNRRRNISGQIGFGDLGNESAGIIDDSFEYPAENEFPSDQLLRQEKEVTGLYLSGHPLRKYESLYKSLDCSTISEVTDQSVIKSGEPVKLLVLLNGVTKKMTRSNQTMAFLQCEDKTGITEVIVFPKTYSSAPQFYIENNILLVYGRVDINSDNEIKVICDHVENCPDPESVQNRTAVTKKKAEGLFLKFDTASSPQVECCSKLIRIFDGNIPLFYYYADKSEYVSNPLRQGVEVNEVLLRELRKILGKDNVIFNE